MKLKRFICLLTVSCLLLSFSTVSLVYANYTNTITGDKNTIVFVDVPEDYWASNEITYFVNQGVVNGYGDGTFRPDEGVTREEFCKLLVSTFNQPLVTGDEPSFSDVDENRWSYPYIEICKDFLTGYANPFGGLPAFHPEEYATREDIAVALVRMMGFTDKDSNDRNYALKFTDGNTISPNLLPYVSIACERGLINGYPDGSFGASQGITRAETIVLLNRAVKQAVTNINSELSLSANLSYSNDGKVVTVHILSEEGTTVTVNGENVKMNNSYNGEYEGDYTYEFKSEGDMNFVVEGNRSGKTKVINLSAEYIINKPVLTITECPNTSSKKEITIQGTVANKNSDSDDYINLTINGDRVDVWGGNWSKDISLKEGKNTITIVATSSSGKSTTETRTVTFNVDAPVLTITNCPKTSNQREITIKGTVSDENSSTLNDDWGYGIVVVGKDDNSLRLTVNDEDVYVNNGNWSKDITLEEGENTITVVARNSLGKSTTETRTVTFNIDAPTLTITSCPETTNQKELTIKGTVSDANDAEYDIELTVNDECVHINSGNWSHKLNLKEGENTITIVARNSSGKSATETRTITFGSDAPTLTITNCPETTDSGTIMIEGTASDVNDYSGNIEVTVNGEWTNINSNGAWSKELNLDNGDNTIKIVAKNSFGKSTTEERKIKFTAGAPKIVFFNCPGHAENKNVTVSGRIEGENTGAKLFINDIEEWVDYNGEFSIYLDLNWGNNNLTFKAVNTYGKSVTVQKNITYGDDPSLSVRIDNTIYEYHTNRK